MIRDKAFKFASGLFLAAALFLPIQPVHAKPVQHDEKISSFPSSKIDQASIFEATFSDLGFQDAIILSGPYQQVTTTFSLPGDWHIDSPVEIEMQVESEFQSLLEAFTSDDQTDDQTLNKSGILRIEVNGNEVGKTIIEQNGLSSLLFVIPPEIFEKNTKEIDITISWDSGAACQQSVHTIIQISPDSKIQIPYIFREIHPQMRDFPYPFYSTHNIDPHPLAILLPENPDEDELSALMAVSAGIGKQTGGKASFEIYYINEVSSSELEDHQLILISKSGALNQFFKGAAVKFLDDLPTPLSEQGIGTMLIQASPWNSNRALLIVSGDDGPALQRASAAVASSDFLTLSDGNRVNITEAADPLSKIQWQIDHPLGEYIDENDLHVDRLRNSIVEIPFYIPGDIQINPESYLELYFRHSQLINYLQSSITVILNDDVIGTIRFSDQSASNGLARFVLPPNSIRPLINTLKFNFSIVPQDICADERSGNYWISIFNDSYLHLAPSLKEVSDTNVYYLDGLQNAFLRESSLSNLTFVANQKDHQSWKYASMLANQLGVFSKANVMLPSALFPDTFKSMTYKEDTIIIGQTNDVPFISGINDTLPILFRSDGSIEEILNDGIQFEFDDEQSFGILEMLSVGESANNNLLGIFGNSPEGLEYAFKSAVNRFGIDQGDAANIEIIDQAQVSHTYFIRQKSQINDEGQLDTTNWYDRLVNISTNRIAAYLLIGFILITVLFSMWAIRKKPKNRS